MGVTNGQLIEFYKKCESHYTNTDSFIREFQQKDTTAGKGYMANAHSAKRYKKKYKINVEFDINKDTAEPNQKYHFLCSYYEDYISWGDYDWTTSELWNKEKKLTDFRCPELLLWLVEAANVYTDEEMKAITEEAKKICRDGDNSPDAREAACKRIKEMVDFDRIYEKINKENPR